MAKPSQVPVWASDASYTSGVESGTDTKTEPSAGRKTQGWQPAAKPPAQEFNWWWNLVGQWVTWLTGFFTIDGSDNLTVPADVVLNSNKNFQVSGTGVYKHGNIERILGGATARVSDGGTGTVTYPSSGYQGSIKVGVAFVNPKSMAWDFPMDVGQRIKSVTIRAKDGDGVTANAIGNFDVIKIDSTGSSTSLGTLSSIALTGALADVTIDVTDTVIASGDIVFAAITGGISANVEVQHARYTYDRP